MSAERNRQIARDFIDATVKSDGARLDALMADEATYWIAGQPHLLPPAGLKTKSEFIKMMTGASAFKGPISMTIGAITAESDHVAMEAESNAVLQSGKLYNNHYHFLFTIRGGKIVSVKEYMDTHHAFDAFFTR